MARKLKTKTKLISELPRNAVRNIQILAENEKKPVSPEYDVLLGPLLINFFRRLPDPPHKCGTRLERRLVPVSKKVFSNPEYEVDYCPKCEIYIYKHGKTEENGIDGIESKQAVQVGGYVTFLQMKTNLKFFGVPYPLIKE